MRLVLVLAIGLGAGAFAGVSAPALDWGLGVGAVPPPGAGVQRVNRTHKADRLDVPMSRVEKQPSATPKMLIGCEPLSSPLSRSLSASMPGRCSV